MSLDGTPVKNVLEATRAELDELSRYCERVEEALRVANARTAAAEARAAEVERHSDLCLQVAQGILWHRKLEVAAAYDLLNDLKYRELADLTKTLAANLEQAMRAARPPSSPAVQASCSADR